MQLERFLIRVISVNFNANVMKLLIEMRDEHKEMKSSVEYLHYLVSRLNGSKSDCEENIDNDRITNYIPCQTFHELQTFNLKLETDKSFFNHCVSHFLSYKFFD